MKWLLATAVSCFFAFPAAAQKPKPAAAPVKPIIFAVLSDGGVLEPIAYVNKGKLSETVSGGDAPNKISAFDKTYYKSGTNYRLIFGSVNAGTVTVKNSNPSGDCGKNMGNVTTSVAKTPLKGLVMALATNASGKSAGEGVRRKPTASEKEEIESLVKAEYQSHKITPNVLRYQNFTALDVDHDGKPEFVGSYWVEIDKLTRALLFFMAAKGSNGKYALGYREYRTIDQSKVMSGEIKSVDEGVYHELLLDAFDYDGDGTSEIFTYQQSFEGAGFVAYKRAGGKWTKAFESSNYHCAY
jgi:hypothetical protein